MTIRFVNVLFTSVGRRVELLRAFRRAYESLNLAGRIVAVDIDPLAPALRVADACAIVPRVNDENYPSTLLEICRRHDVNVVFPLIDADVPVLAGLAPALNAIGTHVATVPASHVDAVSDKWLTVQLFKRMGLPTPASWLPDDFDPKEADYPLFVKPRFGSASAHTYAARTPQELTFFQQYVPHAMIQQFLPGPEITSDVVCDQTGALLSIVSRRRIEVRWGEVAKGVTCFNPVVTDACGRIAKALDARGPITVQGISKNGLVYFTEVNARFGGGAPLGIAAGADFPQWLLGRAAGIDIEVPPIGSYATDVYLTRFDESFFLSPAADGTLQSHHS